MGAEKIHAKEGRMTRMVKIFGHLDIYIFFSLMTNWTKNMVVTFHGFQVLTYGFFKHSWLVHTIS